MKRSFVSFNGPRRVSVESETISDPKSGEVLVETRCSAISAGTELLAYRGEVPADMPLDATLPALDGRFQFPFRFGYAAVGEVVATGELVSQADWLGIRVFAFQPHQSHFTAPTRQLIRLPDDIADPDALFLPNLETALTLVMDGRPIIGERVRVFGLGIVGLLTTALLSRFPLARIIGVDPDEFRRAAAAGLKNVMPLSPEAAESAAAGQGNPDLIFELSGNPEALDQAVRTAGFDTRIVIGSWYGTKPVKLMLGGRFHRNRVRLHGSQVSTFAPDRTGRWSASRRLETVMDLLRSLRPARWITHEFGMEDAPAAYAHLDGTPRDTLQVILTYDRPVR